MVKSQISEQLLSSFLNCQPDPTVYYLPVFSFNNETVPVDFEIIYCNIAAAEQTGVTQAELTGQKVLSLIGANEDTRISLFEQLVRVYQTNESSQTTYYNPVLNQYFNAYRKKVDNGVLTIAKNITAEVLERREKEHQSDLSNLILNSSLNGWFSCEAVWEEGRVSDFLITRINPGFTRLVGMSPTQVVGKRYLSLFPTSKEVGSFDLNCRVLATGTPERKQMHYKGDGLDAWYDVVVTRLDQNSILATFADITYHQQAIHEIKQQKSLLDNILTYSYSAISVGELIRDEKGSVIDVRTVLANDAAIKYTGIPREMYLSKPASELDPNFMTSPFFQIGMKTMETGESAHTQYFLERAGKWLDIAISKMDQNHLITIFTDITTSKEAQLEVERSAQKLHTIINTSQAGFFLGAPVLDEKGEIIDFKFTMVNNVLAAFVDKEPNELMGELGSSWFIEYKKNGLFEKLRHTYIEGTKSQFDFHYLGETVEVWANIMVTKLGDEILGTFTDFTPIKKLQLQLELSIEELKRSNASLEEFSYAASHDLKEPVRKIRTFLDRLKTTLLNRMTEGERSYFERMETATMRMQLLIDDLLEYSHVRNEPVAGEQIDLNQKLNLVISDLELAIEEKKAQIRIGKLPVVKGNRRQLQQLFQNLLSNALKYSKPGVVPMISVYSQVINGANIEVALPQEEKRKDYYLLEIKDNGIGFDQNNADRIFHMFYRLHGKNEYTGTGVGLTIAKKVVENHKGFIYARSEPGVGSSFFVGLPVNTSTAF